MAATGTRPSATPKVTEEEPNVTDVRLAMPPSTTPDATGNYPLPVPGITNYL